MTFRTYRAQPRHVNPVNTNGLAALMIRIARADRAAFARLHAQLRPGLATHVATVPLGPADVAAVTNATFIEVWRLAGRSPERETDAVGWIYAIAARRAGDRWAARMAVALEDEQPMDLRAMFDRQIQMELDTLLARSAGAGHDR
ncbi:hypothetical protein AB0H83_12055 [Dactylosporangium sp. NPDC050688]|uniref:hypothetical protein n=1 Tax=Dactylosporangium sp. NPDC050688 TaxID=3157217 RepID=UPI0033F9045F